MPRVFSKNRDFPDVAHSNNYGRIATISGGARYRHFLLGSGNGLQLWRHSI